VQWSKGRPHSLPSHETNQLTSDVQLFLALDKNLLFLLDLLNDTDVDLENVGNSISGSQSKPLSKRNISDTVTLVELDPNQLLGLRSVLDVVA
jgi:hypothetical protein